MAYVRERALVEYLTRAEDPEGLKMLKDLEELVREWETQRVFNKALLRSIEAMRRRGEAVSAEVKKGHSARRERLQKLVGQRRALECDMAWLVFQLKLRKDRIMLAYLQPRAAKAFLTTPVYKPLPRLTVRDTLLEFGQVSDYAGSIWSVVE